MIRLGGIEILRLLNILGILRILNIHNILVGMIGLGGSPRPASMADARQQAGSHSPGAT